MRNFLTPRNIITIAVVLIVMIGGAIMLPVPLPGIQLPAEHIPGTPITNTLLATLLADATLLVLAFFATRKILSKPSGDVPSGLQNVAEYVVETFGNFQRSVAGKNWQLFFPIVTTYLLFLVVANWWELVPGFDSIGIIERVHEGTAGYGLTQLGPIVSLTKSGEGYTLIPFLRGAATDLNLTLGLALVTQVYVQIMGFRFLGLGYLKKFFVNPLKNPIGSFVGILEIVSEFSKIISLAFRLFGNIFAGQVLLFVIPFLIPYFVSLPFLALEIFVGFMQAFVFAALTLIFASEATISHETHAPEAADMDHPTPEEVQLAHA